MFCETAVQVIDWGEGEGRPLWGHTAAVGGSAACPALASPRPAPLRDGVHSLTPRRRGRSLGEVTQVAWASEKLRAGNCSRQNCFSQTSRICNFPDAL